ncbi:ABC transporter substrate-binding protein [Plantactinospora sp. KLBMP9567]|uniref:ABC transporter substrate-binding protein n=1 Tax=Plantactinospora sp. KLBMP9567 TaxID=3085900 RepID=UPI002981998B|nr:ABC transporter substrate-binding protein [Plantactinospora sp. KLBMP9567]MDW5327753.1 ABC transporter substrate-binding protein [Plantactinospora sp. KLBMP9567]
MTLVLTRRRLLAGAAVTATAAIAACNDGDGDGSGGSELPVEKVSILSGAGFQGREAPIFVARAKGWFTEVGLEVQVLPGKGTTSNLQTLAGGQATFATVDVNGAMIEFTRGGGIKNFRLTSVLHQRNLACFVALKSSGIATPRDLAGRTLSYLPGGINYLLFSTYARLAGFDPSKVKWVSNPIATQHAAMLAQKKVDAISQFVPAVESVRTVAKQDLVTLPFTDYIGDLHGSAIGVTTETAQKKPDLVRRFNRALLRGLEYAINHPEEAGQIYASEKETQGQPPAAAVAEVKALRAYVEGISDGPLGHFSETRMAKNIAILQAAGTIPVGLTPKDIIASDLVG